MGGMQRQLEFAFGKQDPMTLLHAGVASGRLFWTVRQVAGLLDASVIKRDSIKKSIRRAVALYHLDAILVGGMLRFPWNAIERYLEDWPNGDDDQSEETTTIGFYKAYDEWIASRIEPCFMAVRSEYAHGKTVDMIAGDLKEWGHPLSNEEILRMAMRETASLDDLSEREEHPNDWYGLDELGLPLEAYPWKWSGLLQMCTKSLCDQLRVEPAQSVGREQMEDFLTAREFVNMPVPLDRANQDCRLPASGSKRRK